MDDIAAEKLLRGIRTDLAKVEQYVDMGLAALQMARKNNKSDSDQRKQNEEEISNLVEEGTKFAQALTSNFILNTSLDLQLASDLNIVLGTLRKSVSIHNKDLADQVKIDDTDLLSNQDILNIPRLEVVSKCIKRALESTEVDYPVVPAIVDTVTVLAPRPFQTKRCRTSELLYENCTDAKAEGQMELTTTGKGSYDSPLCQAIVDVQVGMNKNFQSSEPYTDEGVTSFINQFDVVVKPDSDELQEFDDDDTCGFVEFEEELTRQGGRFYEFPSFLDPTLERLEKTYGRVYGPFSPETSGRQFLPPYVLFCALIKEMEDLKLEQVDEKRLLRWRTAINAVEVWGLEGSFVREHMKKIGRALFGLKARDADGNCWHEEKNSQLRQECLREAEFFQDKPLSTGLL